MGGGGGGGGRSDGHCLMRISQKLHNFKEKNEVREREGDESNCTFFLILLSLFSSLRPMFHFPVKYQIPYFIIWTNFYC